jgi:integrase
MEFHPDIRRLRLFFGLIALARDELDTVRCHLAAAAVGSFGDFLNQAEQHFRDALAEGEAGSKPVDQFRAWWLSLSEAGALHPSTPKCWLNSGVSPAVGLTGEVTSIVLREARLAAIQDCRARTSDPLTTYDRMLERLSVFAPAESRTAPPPRTAVKARQSQTVTPSPEQDSEAHRLMTPTQAAEAYIAAHPRATGDGRGPPSRQRLSWTGKTRRQFEAAVRLLEKSYGAEPLSLMRQADLLKLDELLSRMPPHHHKRREDNGKSLEQICVEAEYRLSSARNSTTRLGLSVGTTNRHYRFLRILCDWMASQVPSMARLDWSPVMFRDVRDPREHRAAFAPSEARKLFTLPPWRGCRSEDRRMHPGQLIVHDAGYWVIPIAWYTGMRREEICKLLVSDFECVDDIWCINVRDTEAGRTKNAASRRTVPLASELLRLGLPEFVEAKRDREERYLFPELIAPGAFMGDVFYKLWWRRFRDHVPVGTTLHSIRHMVADELKYAGFSEEERADLLGHKLQSETAGRYSKSTRIQRTRAMVDALPTVTSSLRPEPMRLPRSASVMRRLQKRMAEAGVVNSAIPPHAR